MRRASLLGAPIVAFCCAACTTNQVGVSPTPVPVVVAQTAKLQLAVGTANIAGQANAQVTGLNIVTTFRQTNGQNATGLNDPVLTAPPAMRLSSIGCGILNPGAIGNPLPVASAPPNQLSGVTIPQLVAALKTTTTYPAGLGQFGAQTGVFGYGLGSYNAVPQVDLRGPTAPNGFTPCFTPNLPFTSHVDSRTLMGGTALNSAELALPIGSGQPGVPALSSGNPIAAPLTYAVSAAQMLPITTYGGPPGWPSPQGYGNFSYFDGYPEGFTDFGITPVAGSYSLSVTYPTSSDYAQSASLTATATLTSAGFVLPPMPAPVVTRNSDGSGIVALTVPAGVAETIVNVSSEDCDPIDRPGEPTNHYSIVTKASGPQVLFLSSNLGPPDSHGNPTHTFCTTSDLVAYNAYLTSGGQATLPNLSGSSTCRPSDSTTRRTRRRIRSTRRSRRRSSEVAAPRTSRRATRR
ncbi:MAG: hypothetical protein IAI48_01500 [Candidatus Eremiobacteraeota bacterium]|nr:hypothetical protein [Candidatus Eremiobacteraeota bacterium]